ncbi:hypothetical protein GCM10010124_22290 [Pilimelia terevasa]|uniref:Uncharacterized protein n=1 Tax=Pilimelia terevasa TaxID=53372 RepID=A0A8J3BM49_9ACTN|nr:HAD domain-containing protein [Pilimelia terevasa]GGK29056.1 hypothetical protein GCM10010124_22290 [Pilimelia terevasa]
MTTLEERLGLAPPADPAGAPVWLLDVDGVINARKPRWSAAPHHGTAHAAGFPYPMRWAPALLDRIRDLHTAGGAQVVWCSTWCAFSNQVERLFRLPPLERAFADQVHGEHADRLKVEAARRVLARGRRLIWTDDEVVPLADSPLHAELTGTGRALLIRPESRAGLNPEHMDTIEAFTASAQSATGSTGTGTADC